MSDVVVDASLAVQWFVEEEHSTEARRLLREWEEAHVRRIAPSWFACEVGNVVYRRLIRGQMTLGRARIAVDLVLGQVVTVDVEPAITQRAIEFADRYGHGASYDAQYLALAEHLGCEIWTSDQRLWRSTGGELPWVRWIGEKTVP
jgi:predicted nucleic acid-binding protein